MSAYQREVFADGVVEYAEYEEAVLRTVGCMREAGLVVDDPVPSSGGRFLEYSYEVVADSDAELAAATAEADAAYARCYVEFEALVGEAWLRQTAPSEEELDDARSTASPAACATPASRASTTGSPRPRRCLPPWPGSIRRPPSWSALTSSTTPPPSPPAPATGRRRRHGGRVRRCSRPVLAVPLVLVLVALPASPPERDQLFGAQPELDRGRVGRAVHARPPGHRGGGRGARGGGRGRPALDRDGHARPRGARGGGAHRHARGRGRRRRPALRVGRAALLASARVAARRSARTARSGRSPGRPAPTSTSCTASSPQQGLYTGTLEPGTPFGSATAAAVRELARRLGDGANPGVFAPGMVVWGVRDAFVVGEVEAAVGRPAPAPGAPLLAVAGARYSVTVTDDTGSTVSAEGREGWRFVVDPLDVALGDLVAGRLPPGLVPDGGDLRVEGRVEGPARRRGVPAAAGRAGRRRGADVRGGVRRSSEPATVEVQVVGATSGQVVVSGLADGDELVANPAAARGIVRC